MDKMGLFILSRGGMISFLSYFLIFPWKEEPMSFISFGFLSLSELKKKKFGKLPKRCRFFIFLFVNFEYLYFPLFVVLKLCLSFIPLYVPSSLVFIFVFKVLISAYVLFPYSLLLILKIF